MIPPLVLVFSLGTDIKVESTKRDYSFSSITPALVSKDPLPIWNKQTNIYFYAADSVKNNIYVQYLLFCIIGKSW